MKQPGDVSLAELSSTLINQTKKLFLSLPNRRQTVLCKRRIAKKYLLGLFTFDFLANAPLALAMLLNVNIQAETYNYLMLFNLFRIFRLPALVGYLRRILVQLEVEDKYLEIFKLLLYWLIYIHWSACLHLMPGVVVANFRVHGKVGCTID